MFEFPPYSLKNYKVQDNLDLKNNSDIMLTTFKIFLNSKYDTTISESENLINTNILLNLFKTPLCSNSNKIDDF